MENTRQEESLEIPIDIEVKVDNVTVRSKIFVSVKTNLGFIYNKFMKLVSCSTNTLDVIDTTREPSTSIEDPVVTIMKDKDIAQQVIEEKPETLSLEPVVPVVPVVIEQHVSIEEHM